jgi:thioredoxin-related protein
MMNKLSLVFFFFSISLFLVAQEEKPQLYDPSLDAQKQLAEALQLAKQENKHVLIQVGGNWCPWCTKLHDFIRETPKLDSLVKADYVWIRINYSRENKNPEMMERLGFPQRFGFPVLVILDQDGNRLHTQNTGILEKGDFYSEEKIAGVLSGWNRRAVDSETYTVK